MKKKTVHTGYRFAALAIAGLLAGSLLTGCGSRKNEIRDTPPEPAAPTQEEGSAAGSTVGSVDSGESTPLSAAQGSGTDADDLSGEGRTVTSGTDQASAGDTGAQTAVPDYLAGAENVNFSAEGKNLLIVIDPGHASQVPAAQEPLGPGSTEMKDADSIGTYGQASALHEYDLTMMVSRKLRTELENRGYQVLLTHYDTVQPIGCVERAKIANDNKADAFIRIHANSTTDVKANGAMTICITEDNPFHSELYDASVRLSQILLDTYCEETGIAKEYVWKTDTMSGNNWSEVPTTMIELGYMSNPDEDLNMAQDSQQLRMAKAIADSLDLWFGLMPEEELSMHPGLTGEVPGRSTSPAQIQPPQQVPRLSLPAQLLQLFLPARLPQPFPPARLPQPFPPAHRQVWRPQSPLTEAAPLPPELWNWKRATQERKKDLTSSPRRTTRTENELNRIKETGEKRQSKKETAIKETAKKRQEPVLCLLPGGAAEPSPVFFRPLFPAYHFQPAVFNPLFSIRCFQHTITSVRSGK